MTTARPGLAHLVRILAGTADDQTTAWLQLSLTQWIESAGATPIERALGLPSGGRIAPAIRDYWLSAALIECSGNVARLHRACLLFQERAWPVWCDLDRAPSSASRIERALFLARGSAPFPGSARRLSQILRPTHRAKLRLVETQQVEAAGREDSQSLPLELRKRHA